MKVGVIYGHSSRRYQNTSQRQTDKSWLQYTPRWFQITTCTPNICGTYLVCSCYCLVDVIVSWKKTPRLKIEVNVANCWNLGITLQITLRKRRPLYFRFKTHTLFPDENIPVRVSRNDFSIFAKSKTKHVFRLRMFLKLKKTNRFCRKLLRK